MSLQYIHKRRSKVTNKKVSLMVLTALFTALTAVGAFIRIPTPTVAFTLQILFVFLAGILLGPAWGALSQLLYVLLGLIGVPIFTGGGGLGYVFQPSFGFLLGYIGGAALTGWIARGGRPALLRLSLACAAGLAVIYAVGLPYMAWVLNVHLAKGLPASYIMTNGCLIFLPWDGVKLAAAVALSKALLPLLRRMQA
ncbi:MAG: biotin transporter BioY [Lachnospiraceae bacterium]|nr:biotin transporter BioY [Lachnospiraceae bacterium]